MTKTVLSRKQSQLVDRIAIEQYGIPAAVLMENAGRGIADHIERLGIAGPVAIACGKGNNGGDGFVVARHLELRGYTVRVLFWGDERELSPESAANYRVLNQCALSVAAFGAAHDASRLARELDGVQWIVDGLLGTGARGEPRPPVGEVIAALNAHPAPKLAIDLPSGLDCDTGTAAANTILAAHTFTMVAWKRGFLNPAAADYTGEISVLDIGTPRGLLEHVLSTAPD